MANLLNLTNDALGYREEIKYFSYGPAGNITAVTDAPVFMAPYAGTIVSVDLSAQTFPVSTDRTLSATVKKLVTAGTSTAVCTTDPAFALTASGTGMRSTLNAGTGITAAVVKSDGTQVIAAGTMVTTTVAIAGSNGTLGTGVVVTIGFKPATV